MNRILLIFFLFFIPFFARSQMLINGKVISLLDSVYLNGASVRIKGKTSGTTTNASGYFTLTIQPRDTLVVSYTGYSKQELLPPHSSPLLIRLKPLDTHLDEVIVFTGYQTLPKERATGSLVSFVS